MKDDPYEPTEEEKRNGWTRTALKDYMIKREQEQAKTIFIKKPLKPTEQNHRYRPHKWRS